MVTCSCSHMMINSFAIRAHNAPNCREYIAKLLWTISTISVPNYIVLQSTSICVCSACEAAGHITSAISIHCVWEKKILRVTFGRIARVYDAFARIAAAAAAAAGVLIARGLVCYPFTHSLTSLGVGKCSTPESERSVSNEHRILSRLSAAVWCAHGISLYLCPLPPTLIFSISILFSVGT